MRNDFGNRPYSVRFPYGSGGSANGKKFTRLSKLKMFLQEIF